MLVTQFVYRLYKIFLDRDPRVADPGGLEGWCRALITGTQSGSQVAREFVESKEFQGRNFSIEQYVEKMYLGLLGRSPDPEGFAGWVSEAAKRGRSIVFDGFIVSAEWKSIMAFYGIK